MNVEKLSSDEVPQKFAEWLLSMGCPSEKVPSVYKLTEICRGLYYMVWRSVMELVEPKDSIKTKRLQIFIDDIQRCQKRNAFCKPDSSVVVPEELSLWKEQAELRERLEHAETRLAQAKLECNKLVDKVSSRLSHRNLIRVRVENAQRRTWLLQQVANELRNKKANLVETKSIADSLCHIDDSIDIEAKLDKCTSTRRQNSRALSGSACVNALQSSITSNNGDFNDSDEYISLARCGGAALWPRLCARRAALVSALERACASDTADTTTRVSPQWVLSHTASLHCGLALGALKHRAHVEHTRARFAHALTQLESGTSCERELVVVLSELANADARVTTFRELLDDVTHKHGAFATSTDTVVSTNSGKQIAIVDKAIESKRDELRRVMTSLAVTERKIQNVREYLINVFNSFHSEGPREYNDNDKFGGQLSMPQESIAALRRFYEEKRDKQRNKMELSMNFDTSMDYSYNEDIQNPKFVDELKVYLKKFNLEQNRKLILESGEKVWIFETLQSSIDRFHTTLQDLELSCSLICPSVSLRGNLQRLLLQVQARAELSEMLRALEGRQKNDMVIDVPSRTEEEQKAADKIKKCLNENLLSLQKTLKTLELGEENLKLWSENQMRKHISNSRKIAGRTYKEYESCYVENLSLNM